MQPGWWSSIGAAAVVALLASASLAEEEGAKGEPPAETATAATPPTDDRLVAVGGLSGAHLYTTYNLIGTVADAHRSGIYKGPRVREMMAEVIELARSSSQHLRKLRDGNLVDSDKRVIDEFLAVYELLSEEADALSDYAQTDSAENLERFKLARTAAWPKLKAVLGIREAQTPPTERKTR